MRRFGAAALLVVVSCGDDTSGGGTVDSSSASGISIGAPSSTDDDDDDDGETDDDDDDAQPTTGLDGTTRGADDDDDETGDPPVECDAPRQACGDACVLVDNDEAHCGGCGLPCAPDQPCVDGSCVTTTLHQLLIAGQSLSAGSTSFPVVSIEQPFENVSFNPGVRTGATGLTSFIPLVESVSGNQGETIASGAANLLHELAMASGLSGHRTLASCHGVGGQPYSALAPGTQPYLNGIAQATAGAELAAARGESHAVRAVAVVHGESDHVGGNQTYADNLLEWQAAYEADVMLATGQTRPVPMFLCQMSSFTAYGSATSVIPTAQLAAADQRPASIFVVGPKYFLPYTDGVHLSADGERWLGEYYAKALHRVLVEGEPWTPLRPAEITRIGTEIRVEFAVPQPPLVLDTVAVSDPGSYGFAFSEDAPRPATIVDVQLDGPQTVVITLSAAPSGAAPTLAYAMQGVPDQPAGPMTGARGNLRDTDTTPSRHGYPLYNWGVHFRVDVP